MNLRFVIIIITVLISGCISNKKSTDLDHPKYGSREVEIIDAWIPYDLPENNPMLNMGIFKGDICFITSQNDRYEIVFYSITGEKKRSVSIHRGKGPGELMNPSQSFIRDERFCFYDRNRLILSMFDMNGKFITDVQFDEKQINPYAVDVTNNILYFNDPLSAKIGIIDMCEPELPKLVKTIRYDTLFSSTDDMMAQTPRYALPFYDAATGKLILSETDDIFTLSEFSSDLSFQNILFSIPGSYMNIGSYCNNRYFFIPSMIDFKTLRGESSLKTAFKIDVIARDSGKHLYTLKNKELPPINGLFTILGETRNNLIIDVTLFEPNTSYAAFSKNKYPVDTGAVHWVLVIKIPDI